MRDDKNPPAGCRIVKVTRYPFAGGMAYRDPSGTWNVESDKHPTEWTWEDTLAYPELNGLHAMLENPEEFLEHENLKTAEDALRRGEASERERRIILDAFGAYASRVARLEVEVERLETWRAVFGRGYFARVTASARNAWVRLNLKRAEDGRNHDLPRLGDDWVMLTLCGAGGARDGQPGSVYLPEPLIGIARKNRYVKVLEVDGCPLRSVTERARAIEVLTYWHDFDTPRACKASLRKALRKIDYAKPPSPGTNKPRDERGGT